MTPGPSYRPPPRLAEDLLQRCLPHGVLGDTILGDLRQEYADLAESTAVRLPRLWYWRSAVALSARYVGIRLWNRMVHSVAGRSSRPTVLAASLTDLRYGVRMLVKTPLLALIAVMTIGLGVGITTHSFSTVYGSLIRGVPVPGRDRLTFIDANRPELGIESQEIPIHDFLDVRAQQTSFEDVAAVYLSSVNLAGEELPPERFSGAFVSANALTHLAVPPLLGRTFLAREDAVDASPVAVLAHHVWQNRFGGDPSIIGRSIRVNGEATEIVGVMPEGFRFPFLEDLWLPHRLDVATISRGAGPGLDVFGKLREGVSLQVARAELQTIAAGLAERFPESNEGCGIGAEPFELRYMPSEVRAVMWVMLASTFGVLLIACANVANLLLARASIRSREVAIRTAIGASRARVIRQLMVESVLLALLGGTVGLALSTWGVTVLNDVSAGIPRPYWIEIRVDMPVFLFAIVVTAAASVAAGVIPAVQASGVDVGEVLKDESRGSSGFRLGKFSSGLVVTEIAVTCCLLIAAGFLIKSVMNLKNVDLGFEPDGVLTGRVSLPEADYADELSRDQFFNRLKQDLEAEPGVVAATLGTHLPALGSFLHYVEVDGETYAADRDYPQARATVIAPDYFRTFGVDLLRGRDFHTLEATVGGDPVAIVSQSFADRYMGGANAVGGRIRQAISTSEEPWMTVVGIVPDMHVGGGVGGLGNDRMRPERVFVPKGLYDHASFAIAIRTEGPPEAMSGRIREIVSSLDPDLPVYAIAPLDEAIRRSTWAFGQFGSLFTVFGIAALFLASVGLYGVMAFSVGQRRREMGIRMALGAAHSSIVGIVLRKGAVQLAMGITFGLAIGAVMGRPLRYVLYGVQTDDPTVYCSVVTALLAAGSLACIVPARAAARADPVEAIRAS